MKFIERLLCAILGHRYVVERVINEGCRVVGCTRCGKRWGMHDATKSFLPMDAELEQYHKEMMQVLK